MIKRFIPWLLIIIIVCTLFNCNLARRDEKPLEPVNKVNVLKDVQYDAMGGGRIIVTFDAKPDYIEHQEGLIIRYVISNCLYPAPTGKRNIIRNLISICWSQHENNTVWIVLKFQTEPQKTTPHFSDDKLVISLEQIPEFTQHQIPEKICQTMMESSWHYGCPVSLDNLRLLNLSYRNNNGEIQHGQMIVHFALSEEVMEIFKELFKQGFPIEKMNLIDDYKGSDDASMADNNTSAFNCRKVTGGSSYSKHAYGYAIDVNPRVNPYVRGKNVQPPNGVLYLNRTEGFTGKIVKGGPCYQAFNEYGWKWGGDWRTVKDYQHFEKPR